MPWVLRAVSFVVCGVAISLVSATQSFACNPKSVLVHGHIENRSSSAAVLVELVYQKNLVGESDRLILDSETFKTRITFSTQGKSIDLVGHEVGKCGRQPLRVAVVLVEGDQELDRVILNFPHDFHLTDASEYAVREEVVLHGK